MKTAVVILFALACVANATDKTKETPETEKKQEKRGVLGYGYGLDGAYGYSDPSYGYGYGYNYDPAHYTYSANLPHYASPAYTKVAAVGPAVSYAAAPAAYSADRALSYGVAAVAPRFNTYSAVAPAVSYDRYDRYSSPLSYSAAPAVSYSSFPATTYNGGVSYASTAAHPAYTTTKFASPRLAYGLH